MSTPETPLPFERPLGARPLASGGFDVRLWAPHATEVHLVVGDDGRRQRCEPEGLGTFHGVLPDARHGDTYWVDLDGERRADPWSRSQPAGTTGPSQLVDPAALGAVPPGTGGRPARPATDLADAVLYELHVGAFSDAGTFDGAIEHLAGLADLGITHVELLPIGEFPGSHGWGYDGIFWSAAESSYGGPGGLVRLVDAAHAVGLGVLVDVVYNHVGPTGDHTYDAFGPFFTEKHGTPWGKAINVDDAGSGAVRETILQNAEWWVGTVGADGLRVDACHAIVDQSARHVLAELTDRTRAAHPGALVVAESGLNDPQTVRPPAVGGWGFGADWSDDFHHALRVLLTGDRQAWYADFGEVAQLAKAFHRPYVHDGTWSAYRGRRFGAPPHDVAPEHFVVFSQNHDQVGNRPLGDRLPAEARPLAALCTLFHPSTPMLFMGEEHGEDAPFPFFSDHQDPFLADATREGRAAEFADFTAATGTAVPDPQDPTTAAAARLTRVVDAPLAALYRRLLALRPTWARSNVTTEVDEDHHWLRVQRGTSVLVANLSRSPQDVPCPPGSVTVATHPEVAPTVLPSSPVLTLPPLGGAVVLAEPGPATA